MDLSKKWFTVLGAVLLVAVCLTSADEKNKTAQTDTNEKGVDEGLHDSPSFEHSDDYEWSNHDDYSADAPIPEETNSVKGSQKDASTSNITKLEASASTQLNPGKIDNETLDKTNSTVPQPPSNSSETSSPSEPLKPEESSVATNATKVEDKSTAYKNETMESVDAAPPTTVDSSNETDAETVKPSSVVTQDVGDSATKYTPMPDHKHEVAQSGGFRAWAVVVMSVFISFAAIFTILYFIRGAVIRKRKADQRRLLRGSISSEGYFYGDAEGTASRGKFEL